MKRTTTSRMPPRKENRNDAKKLREFYEADETGWLETMAEHIENKKYNHVDFPNLAEFLRDMATRDRREVLSRLTTLIAHLLKWDHQPSMRTSSWESTIRVQRHALIDLCESRTLLNHALEVLPKAYLRGRKIAADEAALPESRFPSECPYSLDFMLQE